MDTCRSRFGYAAATTPIWNHPGIKAWQIELLAYSDSAPFPAWPDRRQFPALWLRLFRCRPCIGYLGVDVCRTNLILV
jgi:hypothetical protein